MVTVVIKLCNVKVVLMQVMKAYRTGGMAPLILILGIRCGYQHYVPQALPQGKGAGTQTTGGCVGHTGGLDILKEEEMLLSLPGFQPRTVQPAVQSLNENYFKMAIQEMWLTSYMHNVFYTAFNAHCQMSSGAVVRCGSGLLAATCSLLCLSDASL